MCYTVRNGVRRVKRNKSGNGSSVEHGYKSNQAEYTIQGNAIHLLWLQVDMLLSFRTSYDGELVGTVRKPIRITVNIYTSATITEIPKS